MKKNITYILAFTMMLLVTTSVFAGGKSKTIQIKTSAVCGECKERIESALFKVDGVKSAKLNLKTDVIKVTFNAEKTNEAALRNTVAAAGYDADGLKADPAAQGKLPACCKVTDKKH